MRRRVLCFLLACMAFGAQAGAPPCGDFSVALYDNGALYSRQPDGSWAGIDKDVVDELARRSGCRFHTRLESRARIWAMLTGGTLDMSVSAIPMPEREKFARFVPYLIGRNFVLLHNDIAPIASTLDAFLAHPDYKVGVVKAFKHGPAYDAWLDKLRAQGRVYEAADFSSLLRLLKFGRVQAIMAMQTSWVPALRREHMTEMVRVMNWAPQDVLVGALVLSRARVPEATATLIANHMRAMRDDGTLKAIYERHVGAELAPGLVYY